MAQMTLAGQTALPQHPLVSDGLLPDVLWIDPLIQAATTHVSLDALDAVLTLVSLTCSFHPDRRYLRTKISTAADRLTLDKRIRLTRLPRPSAAVPDRAWYMVEVIQLCETTEQLDHVADLIKMVIPPDDEEMPALRRIYAAKKKEIV